MKLLFSLTLSFILITRTSGELFAQLHSWETGKDAKVTGSKWQSGFVRMVLSKYECVSGLKVEFTSKEIFSVDNSIRLFTCDLKRNCEVPLNSLARIISLQHPVNTSCLLLVSLRYHQILSAQAELCENVPVDFIGHCDRPRFRHRTSLLRRIRRWRSGRLRVKRKAEESVIQVPTVFTTAASPIDVSKDLTVAPGVTLTIEKGVHMQFAPNTGLKVRGLLIAQGTREAPIMMGVLVKDTKWTGVTFETQYKAYDVRLTGTITGYEGYLSVFNGNEWQYICADGFDSPDADVICKQTGFAAGSVSSNKTVFTSEPTGVSYWLTDLQCTGKEISLESCQSSEVKSTGKCSAPAKVNCKRTWTVPDQNISRLSYLNCTNTTEGIKVFGVVPEMNMVSSQNSLGHGLTIETHFMDQSRSFGDGNPKIFKGIFINNKLSGLNVQLDYPPSNISDRQIHISECISTGNAEEGLHISGRGNLDVDTSAFIGNGHDGVQSKLTAGNVQLQHLLLAGNSRYSTQFFRESDVEPINVVMQNCNVTGHWYGPAALVSLGRQSGVVIEGNRFWHNYQGAMMFGAVKDTIVVVKNNNFTNNFGKILHFTEVGEKSLVEVEKNNFIANANSNGTTGDSVFSAKVVGEFQDRTSMAVKNNLFSGNRMKSIVEVTRDSDAHVNQNISTVIEKNVITGNQVQQTIDLGGLLTANLSNNDLANPSSDCELKLGKFKEGYSINAQNNYWGTSQSSEAAKRICDYTKDSSLLPTNYLPLVDKPSGAEIPFVPNILETAAVTPSGTEVVGEDLLSGGIISTTTGVLPARVKPYSIVKSILIANGAKLIIQPGATLNFGSDKGLRVEGQLIAKGDSKNPVVFQGDAFQSWTGLVFTGKGDAISELENCVIDGAINGLELSTDKVLVRSTNVTNSAAVGVLLTNQSGQTVDLGDSRVIGSKAIGIRIDNRAVPIALKNVNIDQSGQNGITVASATGNLSFVDVSVSKSLGYGVQIDQLSNSHQLIIFDRLTIADHHGKGGLLIDAKDYQSVTVENSLFHNNSVPSVQLVLRCNYSGNVVLVPPQVLIKRNLFRNNTNEVVDISLMYCSQAVVTENDFRQNNLDHRYGTMKISTEPAQGFPKESLTVAVENNNFHENQGEYSCYVLPMSMYDFEGSIAANIFNLSDNRRAVIIVGSPMYSVNLNDFVNTKSQRNLEVEYNDRQHLNAQKNYWGTDVDEQVANSILDGRTIDPRGIADYRPFLNGTHNLPLQPPKPQNCEQLNNCNGNGVCTRDNQCRCHDGFIRADCSGFSCLQLSNCSKNGVCTGPNNCTCMNGWKGKDCLQPICTDLNDCNGRGKCVSFNECQCQDGFSGADCKQSGPSVKCTKNCLHGTCDPITNNCACQPGWTGTLCDGIISPSPAIPFETTTKGLSAAPFTPVPSTIPVSSNSSSAFVSFIVPTESSVSGSADPINVIGDNFVNDPKGYTCVFGDGTSTGTWMSRTLVACPVPTHSKGFVDFQLLHNGQTTPHGNSQLQFHFYGNCNSCDVQHCCHCLMGDCICHPQYAGSKCDVAGPKLPQIDSKIVTTNEATHAEEGKPYQLQLHAEGANETVKYELIRGPSGMTVDTDSGLVTWPKPIGSTTPLNVSVAVLSSKGQSLSNWIIRVSPSYNATVTRVDYNQSQLPLTKNHPIRIEGVVEFSNGSSDRVVPVTLHIFNNGKIIRNITVDTDVNGTFTGVFVPTVEESGNFSVEATHPGDICCWASNSSSLAAWTSLGILVELKNDTVVYSTPLVQIPVKIHNIGSGELAGVTIKSLEDRLNIESVKFSGANGDVLDRNFGIWPLQTITALMDLRIVDFVGSASFEVKTAMGVSRTFVLNLVRVYTGVHLQLTPSKLSVVHSTKNDDINYEVIIENNGDKTASNLRLSPKFTSPLFVVSFVNLNDLNQTDQNGSVGLKPGQSASLFLGVRVLNSKQPEISGNISLATDDGYSLDLPYDLKESMSDTFDFNVTILDEVARDKKTDFHVQLSRQTGGYNKVQTTGITGTTTFSLITDGTYQLTVSANGYNTEHRIVRLSEAHKVETIVMTVEPLNYTISVNWNNSDLGYVVNEKVTVNTDEVQPILMITPGGLVFNDDQKSATDLTFTNEGTDPIYGIDLSTSDHSLFSLTSRAPISSLYGGESVVIPVVVERNTRIKDDVKCDAYLYPIHYNYTVGQLKIRKSFNLVLKRPSYSNFDVKLCKISESGSVEPNSLPIAAGTEVFCSCADGWLKSCQNGYSSIQHCAADLDKLSNFAGFATIIRLSQIVATCNSQFVDLSKTQRAVECLLQARKSCQSGEFDTDTAGKVLHKFDDLMQLATDVLGNEEFKMTAGPWMSQFLFAIADSSELGRLISPSELLSISTGATAEDLAFVYRWNTTVASWIRGVADNSTGVISYSLVKQLANVAGQLGVYSNELNHNSSAKAIDALMTSAKNKLSEDLCAHATVTIDQTDLEIGDRFKVRVEIINRQSIVMTGVRLLVKFLPEKTTLTFESGVAKLEGISDVVGSGQLPPSKHFSAEFDIQVKGSISGLAKFTPDLQLSFANGNRSLLNVPTVTVHERHSLRIWYLLAMETQLISDPLDEPPFTIMVVLFNDGLLPIANLDLFDPKLHIADQLDPAQPALYQLEKVELNNVATTRRSWQQHVDLVGPKTNATVEYLISSPEPADMKNFSITVTSGAKLIELPEVKYIRIVQWLPCATQCGSQLLNDKEFAVSTTGTNVADSIFSLTTGGFTNLTEVESISRAVVTVGDQNYTEVVAKFSSKRPFFGAVKLPFPVNGSFNLINSGLATGNSSNIQIWTAVENGQSTAYIRDNSNSTEPLTYRMIFGPPNDFPPVFSQPKYEVVIPPNTQTGSKIASIAATDKDEKNSDSSHLKYSLYGGDGTVTVNPQTGELKLAKPIDSLIGDVCVNLVATDTGVPVKNATVPVVIGLNGRKPTKVCPIFDRVDHMTNYVEPVSGGQTDGNITKVTSSPDVTAAVVATASATFKTSLSPTATTAAAITGITTTSTSFGTASSSDATSTHHTGLTTMSTGIGGLTTTTTKPTGIASPPPFTDSSEKPPPGVTEDLVKKACKLSSTDKIYELLCALGKVTQKKQLRDDKSG